MDYKNELKQNEEIIIFKTIVWYEPLKKIRDYGFYATFDETNNDEHMKLRGFSDIIIRFQLNEKFGIPLVFTRRSKDFHRINSYFKNSTLLSDSACLFGFFLIMPVYS